MPENKILFSGDTLGLKDNAGRLLVNAGVKKPFSYLSSKAEIRPSPLSGRGIFALEAIKKDEIISVFGGRIISEREYFGLFKKGYRHLKNYAVKVADNFYLVLLVESDFAGDDYFNHSCNPNAGIRGQIVLVAMRNIKPGEEITYDYAMSDDDPDDYLKCRCSSKNCRKVIRGSDWKKSELQKRYRDYFAWHVQEKIDGLKKKRKSHVNSR